MKVTWWRLGSVSRVGPSLLISPLSFLSRENMSYRRRVLPKLVCFVCFFSATEWGRAMGMTFWYSRPCPLHTPSALLVLRQLHYLQDHLPKPRATHCSLICKPESEPAGLRQRRLGQWSQCCCFVALQWLPLSRSHLRKSWAPGQDRWGMWTGNSQHEKS